LDFQAVLQSSSIASALGLPGGSDLFIWDKLLSFPDKPGSRINYHNQNIFIQIRKTKTFDPVCVNLLIRK